MMGHSIAIVLVAGAVTYLLRSLPFLIFPEGKEPPAWVTRFTRLLPPAVMGMLIIYCIREIHITQAPHGLPELIAVAVTATVHLWKKNTLFSIILGTACYMVLLRVM